MAIPMRKRSTHLNWLVLAGGSWDGNWASLAATP